MQLAQQRNGPQSASPCHTPPSRPISNRYIAFVGPERSHRAEGVRSTPLAVALVPNFAETKRACASLIANEFQFANRFLG
jgi:hypothetical protein